MSKIPVANTLLINAYLMDAGHHEAAWRLPESNPHAEWDVDHWVSVAQLAEKAGLHSLFLADVMALNDSGDYRAPGSYDPLTLMTFIAAATEKIGLISTISTTYSDPYGLARRLASVDHLSRGRIGWNVVTSVTDEEAVNFGLKGQLDYDKRYARADEFLTVCTKLWDSWPDDAIVADKVSGRYIQPDRLRSIDHKGEFFDVAGPLNVPRPPQGYPVIVQAGSSPTGISFAGHWADVVFTAHQTHERAQAFYRNIKQAAQDAGRDPGNVKVMPGIVPILGETQEIAEANAERLDDYLVVEHGVEKLEFWIGRSLEGLDLDEMFPNAWFNEPLQGVVSRAELIFTMAKKEQLTIRQLTRRLAGGRGHAVVIGTPEVVADHMEHWFRHEAADGFNVMPARIPGDLTQFIEEVLPLLEERGVFDSQRSSGTLRENLHLPRPANQVESTPPS